MPRSHLFATFLMFAILGCPQPKPQVTTPDPLSELRSLPLVEIEARLTQLEGKDNLDAIDERLRLQLALRNRSPADVMEDPPALSEAERGQEIALRRQWRREHIAWSWDNLNPDAQMGPRPERLSLSWMTLAWHLPLARNGQQFSEPWINDYFRRKAWYRPDSGPPRLSMVDQTQRERIRAELDAIENATLRAHLDALPLTGMSPEEAIIERELALAMLRKRDQPVSAPVREP